MTTFHPFPRLPQEIRDLIWEEAAKSRTEEPGVHFFTIFNTRVEEESAALAQYKVKGPSKSRLAAPRRKDGEGFSWTEGNASMYLDRGLWAACSDSRAAIMKAPAMTMCSESRTCQVCISSDDTAYMAKINDGPQIGRFMLDGHEQEMIVWPENDLFCLQPYKWNTFTWVDPRHTAISPQQCRLHLRHVAFELPRDEILNVPCKYSTQNNEHTPEPSSHPMLSSMISCMDDLIDDERFLHIKNVWMIDYELKRANPRPAAQQFCANGLRFVEVTERDGDKWTDRRGDGKDALEYAGWLKDLNTWQDENNPPEFGVLACEEC